MHNPISIKPESSQHIAQEIVSEECSDAEKSGLAYVVALVELRGVQVVWVCWFRLSPATEKFGNEIVSFIKKRG